jgi:hypothetical protein
LGAGLPSLPGFHPGIIWNQLEKIAFNGIAMGKFIAIIMATLIPIILFGQHNLLQGNFPPPDTAIIVHAVAASGPIILDGKLSEDSWGKTIPVQQFFRMEPRQGGTVMHSTEVRVLFDDKHLYFGVYCRDTLGRRGIRVQDLRRDFIYGENDVFYIQLDPQNLKRFCVSFQTTPYGNQRDLQVFDDSFIDNDWDAWWKVRTHLTDSGYYAEFAIPFVSLRYDKALPDSVSWGINFARLSRRDYEQTVYPAVPQAFSPYRMTYAAQLKGLVLPKPSLNLRVQPYSLVQYDKVVDKNGTKKEKTVIKPGGEIKWAMNPHAVLDLTFNTDFAQADVDRAVNNLTRFNILFAERRQFFLENSGVYTGANYDGIKPFFSRSIGLSNTQFNADPVPIDAGIRFTDRTKDRTIAGLYVRQRETEQQAAGNFAVVRYLKNYGKQNNLGVMLTHRLDEANPIKDWSTRHNTTLSIDGFSRPTDSWQMEYMVSASRNNRNDSIGFSGYFFAGYSPQKSYWGWLTKYVDQKYLPGMGFVFANNTIHHNPGGYFIWRPSSGWWKKWIRRWDPGVFANWYQNAGDLRTQELGLYIFPVYIITSGNGNIEYALYPTEQNFSSPVQILDKTVAAGRYSTFRQMIRYETDASRKFSLTSKFEWGTYYDGKLDALTLGLRLAPSPRAALTFTYEHADFSDFGVLNESFTTDLYTAGIRLAYNPRLQFSGFYQYNSFDSQGRWNLRGSWEFAPLSFVYIVFNENSFRDSPSYSGSFISKISLLKQF